MRPAYGSLAARRRRRRWIRHARRDRARLNPRPESVMQLWLQFAVTAAALCICCWSAADVTTITLHMAPETPAVTAPGHHADPAGR